MFITSGTFKRTRPTPNWEPRLQKVSCTGGTEESQGCGYAFYLGLIAWPAERRSSVPSDTVPRPEESKELSRIRAWFRNLVAPEKVRGRGDPVNIVVADEDPLAVDWPTRGPRTDGDMGGEG